MVAPRCWRKDGWPVVQAAVFASSVDGRPSNWKDLRKVRQQLAVLRIMVVQGQGVRNGLAAPAQVVHIGAGPQRGVGASWMG